MNRVSSLNIKSLKQNEIFVFGSNSHGDHYGGAARHALIHFGAVLGVSEGPQGRCYAINSMSGLDTLRSQVTRFAAHALRTPDNVFLVTEVGCGIASYTPAEVAPLFRACKSVSNIHLPESFWKLLEP